MTASTLIDQWHEQLRETEELIVHGSPQLRWLRIAYARLYRFLLSAYGVVPIDGREEESAGRASRGETLTIDESVDFQGKRARTGAEIRTALKSVHGAKEEVEAGPLQLGLHGTDWIIVATLDLGDAVDAEQRLDAARISCRATRRGNQSVIEVPFRLRAAAREALEPQESDAVGEGPQESAAVWEAPPDQDRPSSPYAWKLPAFLRAGARREPPTPPLTAMQIWWRLAVLGAVVAAAFSLGGLAFGNSFEAWVSLGALAAISLILVGWSVWGRE